MTKLSTGRKTQHLKMHSKLYLVVICPTCKSRGDYQTGYKFFQCGSCGSMHETSRLDVLNQHKPLSAIVAQSRLDVLAVLEQYRAKGWTPPTIRELAKACDTSHDTISRAIEELAMLGIIGFSSGMRRHPRTLTIRITRKEWDSYVLESR